MFAELPVWATETAAWIGFLTLAGGFVAVILRKPVKWLWKRLVSTPVGEWSQHQVTEGTADLRGEVKQLRGEVSSARARIDAVSGELADHMEVERVEGEARAADALEWRNEIRGQIKDIKDHQATEIRTVHARLDNWHARGQAMPVRRRWTDVLFAMGSR